jgi:hypothetical protein
VVVTHVALVLTLLPDPVDVARVVQVLTREPVLALACHALLALSPIPGHLAALLALPVPIQMPLLAHVRMFLQVISAPVAELPRSQLALRARSRLLLRPRAQLVQRALFRAQPHPYVSTALQAHFLALLRRLVRALRLDILLSALALHRSLHALPEHSQQVVRLLAQMFLPVISTVIRQLQRIQLVMLGPFRLEERPHVASATRARGLHRPLQFVQVVLPALILLLEHQDV